MDRAAYYDKESWDMFALFDHHGEQSPTVNKQSRQTNSTARVVWRLALAPLFSSTLLNIKRISISCFGVANSLLLLLGPCCGVHTMKMI